MRKSLALLAVLGVGSTSWGAPLAGDPIARELGRELTDGKYDDAFARFDEPLRQLFARAELERVMESKRGARGPAVKLALRGHESAPEGATFHVLVRWTRGAPTELQTTVRPDGRIARLLIWDHDDPLYDYQTKARLRPPFRGTWTAGNAARDVENHHYKDPNQRFAMDWVIVDSNGKTFQNDGKRNTDYYAYGQDVLAPAAGAVAVAVDGIPENPAPGQVDRFDIPGNQIVLELGNGEYAMLLHLKTGSLRVKRGQRVRAGQVLAKVGSSGHCTEPTLQFQLADHPRLADARSLPATFTRVLVDGEQAERALPIFGTRLSPVVRWDPAAPMREPDED